MKYKDEWIAALRSGDYKQTRGVLRRSDCFCAWGVYCDILTKKHPDQYKWDWNDNFRLTTVIECYNTARSGGLLVADCERLGLDYEFVSTVEDLNDDGMTFYDLADWIANR